MALPGPERGRPKLEIDGAAVEKLASMGATVKEIATVLKCSEDTLQRRFKDELQFGWERMKLSIKRAQYILGVDKRHPTMLIWLGKNYCGQSENAGNRQPSGVNHLESLFKALMEGPVKRGESESKEGEGEKEKDAEPGKDDGGDKGGEGSGE